MSSHSFFFVDSLTPTVALIYSFICLLHQPDMCLCYLVLFSLSLLIVSSLSPTFPWPSRIISGHFISLVKSVSSPPSFKCFYFLNFPPFLSTTVFVFFISNFHFSQYFFVLFIVCGFPWQLYYQQLSHSQMATLNLLFFMAGGCMLASSNFDIIKQIQLISLNKYIKYCW